MFQLLELTVSPPPNLGQGFTMAKDGVVLAATDFRLPSPLPTAAANHKAP